MKKLEKYIVKSTRDDSPMAGRHIHSLHILAFACGGDDFTEKENAHFDVCRACRLRLFDALRNLASLARYVCGTTEEKAA
jgi:hypothetical protein